MFQQCLDNDIMPFNVLDSTKGVVVHVIHERSRDGGPINGRRTRGLRE